jgi:hypothetical protein
LQHYRQTHDISRRVAPGEASTEDPAGHGALPRPVRGTP